MWKAAALRREPRGDVRNSRGGCVEEVTTVSPHGTRDKQPAVAV